MENIKYDIYTFQISALSNLQLNIFDQNFSREQLTEKKNIFFAELFKGKLSFWHRRHKLNYIIEYLDDDFILIRLANKKVVAIEREFHRATFESEPSCLIAIYNNPEIQIIAIESDRTSFGNSKTVKKLLQKTFNRELRIYNLSINLNPKYEEKEFWDLIERFEGNIERLKFEFSYPNLPRVNKHLDEELKEASKLLNSGTTKLEFDAPTEQVLENLNEENKELSNLVKASSEGAGPAKLKIKGYRRWETTENKVKSIEYDELEVDLPKENLKDYVKELKKILRNG